jgi:hypothetical protein
MTDVHAEPGVAPPAPDLAAVCWLPETYDTEARRFAADEGKVTALLAEWERRESASLVVGLDAQDEDLDPRERDRMLENRRLRLREEFWPQADAAMQAARRVVALIEAQGIHQQPDVYYRRASLRAPGLLGRVQGAADVELPALAEEAVRQQSVELAGALHAELARRGAVRPELARAVGEALAKVRIPERENIVGRARALRDRALRAQLALHDRVSRNPGVWKLWTARQLEREVW